MRCFFHQWLLVGKLPGNHDSCAVLSCFCCCACVLIGLQLDVKLADLLQQQKVSQLQMQTLKLSVCERSKRLADKQRRLAALNG